MQTCCKLDAAVVANLMRVGGVFCKTNDVELDARMSVFFVFWLCWGEGEIERTMAAPLRAVSIECAPGCIWGPQPSTYVHVLHEARNNQFHTEACMHIATGHNFRMEHACIKFLEILSKMLMQRKSASSLQQVCNKFATSF